MGTNPLPLNFGNIPLGAVYEGRLVEDLLGGWHNVAIMLAPAAGRFSPRLRPSQLLASCATP